MRRRMMAGVAMILLASAWAGGQDLRRMWIDVPRPILCGPGDYDHLYRKREYLHLVDPNSLGLMVAGDCMNLAFKAPVSSSDSAPTMGSLGMIVDGDKTPGEPSLVELGPGLQWVQIDLLESCAIEVIALWHRHDRILAYSAVVVQVCDDAAFKQGVTTLYNNDAQGVAGLGKGRQRQYIESNQGKVIDGRGVRARYVRLYSRGSSCDDLNHYVEVEVHGRPGPLQKARRAKLLAGGDRWADSFWNARWPPSVWWPNSDEALANWIETNLEEGTPAATELEIASRSKMSLAPIGQLKQLRKLTIWGYESKPMDFGPLGKMKNLKGFALRGSGLKDGALAFVSELSWLEELDLTGAAITDAGLAHLVAMTRLRRLSLAGAPVTDAAIAKLERLQSLERVDLRWTKVSQGGAEALRSRGVEVLWKWP